MSSLHYDGPQNVLCNRPVVARSARAGADTRTPGSLLPVTRARERRHQGDEVVRCRHHHIAEIRRLERRDSKHPLSLALPRENGLVFAQPMAFVETHFSTLHAETSPGAPFDGYLDLRISGISAARHFSVYGTFGPISRSDWASHRR